MSTIAPFLDEIGSMPAINTHTGDFNFFFQLYNITYDGRRDAGFIFAFYRSAFIKEAYQDGIYEFRVEDAHFFELAPRFEGMYQAFFNLTSTLVIEQYKSSNDFILPDQFETQLICSEYASVE